MTRSVLSALGLLTLVGCTFRTPEGIWLIQIPYTTEETCQTQIDHNFNDSFPTPSDVPVEEDWVEDSSTDYSDALFFAQIAVESANKAVMVTGDQIWPGAKDDEGAWVFAWEGVEDVNGSEVHSDGYSFTSSEALSSISRLTMTFGGDASTGVWLSELRQTSNWTESDEWEREIGVSSGQIPSASYLNYEDDNGDRKPRYNNYDKPECDAEECRLNVVESCADSVNVSMTRVGYKDEASYEYLDDNSRPYGTGF